MTTAFDTTLGSRWWYLLAAAIIAVYLGTVIPLLDNTPKYDDLNDAFGFFRQLALAQTPLQKIAAFFYPNNEHITLFNHLLYYTQFTLTSEIRFAPLSLIGHLLMITTGLLLGCVIDSPRKPFYCAVTALAYITLHYWDSTFKAMTALSNQGAILFSIASLFALLRGQRLTVALLLAVLATFTQGNGVLVWPIGLCVLLLDKQEHRQRHTLPIWLLAGAASIALFAWARQALALPLPGSGQSLLQPWLAAPWLPLQAALAMLGSTGLPATQSLAATALGLAAIAVCAMRWQFLRTQPLLAAILLFLLGSVAIAGGLRGLAYGDAAAVVESRYRMYSVAFVMLTGLLWLEAGSPRLRPALAATLLITALVQQTSGFRYIPLIEAQANGFRDSYHNWLVDGDFRRQAVYFPPMSDHFLFVAEHLQLFDFSTLAEPGNWLTPQPVPAGTRCPEAPQPTATCPLTVNHRGNAMAIAVTATAGQSIPPSPAQLLFCDQQGNTSSQWEIAPQAVAQRWYLPASAIPPGSYRTVLQYGGESCEQAFTRKPRKVEQEMQQLFGDH